MFLCVFISIIIFFFFIRSICLTLGHMSKNAPYYQILMIPSKIERHRTIKLYTWYKAREAIFQVFGLFLFIYFIIIYYQKYVVSILLNALTFASILVCFTFWSLQIHTHCKFGFTDKLKIGSMINCPCHPDIYFFITVLE